MKCHLKKIIAFTLFFASTAVQAQHLKVLLIGHSQFGRNDMSNIIERIAHANDKGPTMEVDTVIRGGTGLCEHIRETNALEKIAEGGWDYVVFIEKYRVITANRYRPFLRCAKTLSKAIKAVGAKPLIAQNYPRHPKHNQYKDEKEFDRILRLIRGRVKKVMKQNNIDRVPLGGAWRDVVKRRKSVRIFAGDKSHPSIFGSHLNAYMIYSTITKLKTAGNRVTPRKASKREANILQNTSDKVSGAK